jgi:hypothetical protein
MCEPVGDIKCLAFAVKRQKDTKIVVCGSLVFGFKKFISCFIEHQHLEENCRIIVTLYVFSGSRSV